MRQEAYVALSSPQPIEIATSDEGVPTDEKFRYLAKDGSFAVDEATGAVYLRVQGEWRQLAFAG